MTDDEFAEKLEQPKHKHMDYSASILNLIPVARKFRKICLIMTIKICHLTIAGQNNIPRLLRRVKVLWSMDEVHIGT